MRMCEFSITYFMPLQLQNNVKCSEINLNQCYKYNFVTKQYTVIAIVYKLSKDCYQKEMKLHGAVA